MKESAVDPDHPDARERHVYRHRGTPGTLRHRKVAFGAVGSVAHLQFADMANSVTNSGMTADEIAWAKHSAYAAPHRDYQFDQSLAGMAGQPPFWPRTFKIYLWQEVIP